jgi:Lar family restriction alleviation protein
MFADLLPCPFCGGKALHMTNPLGGMDFWVTCEVCSASTTVYEGKNASVSAYQAWNRRAYTKECANLQAHNSESVKLPSETLLLSKCSFFETCHVSGKGHAGCYSEAPCFKR